MRTISTVLAVAFLSVAELAAQGAHEERVLLPVYVGETPGNFGSRWVSELSVYNGNDAFAQLDPLGPADWPGVAPHASGTFPPPTRLIGGQPGRFAVMVASQGPKLHFNLRILEVSRSSGTWGTEIPVVRESEFHTSPINLLNVPIRDGFRQMLRVYQALRTGDSPGQVRVRFFRMNSTEGLPGGTPLREEVLTLIPEGPPAVFVPGYAQLGDFSFPGIPGLRIEIEPLGAGMRFWAFVSVVHNETQHLTIVTPQ